MSAPPAPAPAAPGSLQALQARYGARYRWRLLLSVMLGAMAALATSRTFMRPVATPPNAIVCGAGVVGAGAMARAGLALNLLALAVLGVLTTLRAG